MAGVRVVNNTVNGLSESFRHIQQELLGKAGRSHSHDRSSTPVIFDLEILSVKPVLLFAEIENPVNAAFLLDDQDGSRLANVLSDENASFLPHPFAHLGFGDGCCADLH